MPAPRKYPKTTESRAIRCCQGWVGGVLEVGCEPLGFEDVDTSPGAAKDARANPAPQFRT